MKKRVSWWAIVMSGCVGLAGCAELNQVLESSAGISEGAGYSTEQLQKGIKETLQLSATRAAEKLARAGGYSDSESYRITLPESLQSVTEPMKRFGLGQQIEQVESLMNRGAEMAADEAKAVFLQAIREMSVDDAMGIIRGGDTAATDYFRAQTRSQLMDRYRPIIQSQLQKLGFYDQYQQLLSAYKMVPLRNKPELDLEERAVDQGVEALFEQIAVEEQKIRANPLEQGSALLAKVFGSR